MSLVLCTACVPPQPPKPAVPAPSTLERAKASAQTGAWTTAAQLYETAAREVTDRQQTTLMLDAATAWVEAGDPARASTILDTTDPSLYGDNLILRKQLLRARIALATGNPEQAYAALESLPYLQADNHWRAQGYRTAGQALLQLRRPLDAARHFARADSYLHSEQERAQNQMELVQALLAIPPRTLEHNLSPGRSTELDGWIELTLLAQSISTPRPLQDTSRSWRQRYPDHPVVTQVWQQLFGDPSSAQTMPRQVALLLPLSGTYAAAGNAVLDGFLSRYYSDASAPEVTVLDTSDPAADLQSVVTGPLSTRLDAVIGPLQKEPGTRMLSHGAPTVPVLLLNQLDGETVPDRVFQFGLPPESDGEAAADFAIRSGYRRALVLRSDEEWARRAVAAFSRQFADTPGRIVLAEHAFDRAAADHGGLLRDVLDLDDSAQRRRRLENLLGMSLESAPRRRQDADFIFMAAAAEQARVLVPQIRFHHADDLPIVATSHIHAADGSESLDRDLDGVMFCDAPALLEPQAGGAPDSLTIGGAGAQKRLAALGADAYVLLPYLDGLKQRPLFQIGGRSGVLRLEEQGIIRRSLACGRFKNGVPQMLAQQPDAKPLLR